MYLPPEKKKTNIVLLKVRSIFMCEVLQARDIFLLWISRNMKPGRKSNNLVIRKIKLSCLFNQTSGFYVCLGLGDNKATQYRPTYMYVQAGVLDLDKVYDLFYCSYERFENHLSCN